MKLNKGILILIVLALVGGGIVAWKSMQKTPPQQESTVFPDAAQVPTGARVVKMGDDAYAPADFTIKKGTTVSFVNESKDYRWPASDLHPTHEIYPAFDPREPVPPKKLWSFTFDQVGTWKWHDHLVPYLVGTITVEE